MNDAKRKKRDRRTAEEVPEPHPHSLCFLGGGEGDGAMSKLPAVCCVCVVRNFLYAIYLSSFARFYFVIWIFSGKQRMCSYTVLF